MRVEKEPRKNTCVACGDPIRHGDERCGECAKEWKREQVREQRYANRGHPWDI